MDMRRLGCIVLGFTLFAVFDGLLLGLYVGLSLQPSEPAVDFQPDPAQYVTLVGAAYASDHDIGEARRRLRSLDPDEPKVTRLVVAAAERARTRNDGRQADALASLAQALGAPAPVALIESAETATPTATFVPPVFATPVPTEVVAATATRVATAPP